VRSKVLLISVTCVLVIGLVIGGCAAPAPTPAPTPTPIKLSMLGFQPDAAMKDYGYFLFIDRVNELSNGELVIEHKGGPEIVKSTEQFHAVRSGVVDLNLSPYITYNPDLLPISTVVGVSNLAPNGVLPQYIFDVMQKEHESLGTKFLGMTVAYLPFYLYLKDKVETTAELEGLKIRTGGSGHGAFVKGTGMMPLQIPLEEMYTAVERGVADGFTMHPGAHKLGMHEVCKYVCFPPYKTGAGPSVVMNLDIWNGLPKHLQDVIWEVMPTLLTEGYARDVKLYDNHLQVWKDAGAEFIEFTDPGVEKYASLYDNFIWDHVKNAMDPAEFQKLKDVYEQSQK